MFGRLTLEAFKHDSVTMGGVVTMFFVCISAVCAMFYFKRWRWLWSNWLTSLDPKKIGVMYIIVALIMLVRGVADAMMMRTQQVLASGDGARLLSSDHFQQVFTAHGTIMIFFAAMGLMFGLINIILPLQIGARDVAFPFLNSVSFWLFVAGMVLINISLPIGNMAATGWLAYPPLSGLEYSPGVGVDYWIWSIQIAGIGSLLSGVNFITTIAKLRAPGMKLMRMPVFVWTVLGAMILVVFAFPILTGTLAMLSLDRTIGTHYFTSGFGGNPMMYVNLIWAWGHPEVYILILPAFGIFSEVVATFSRKRLFGYTSMVVSICAIVVLSFLVWLHHFFTMGAGANVNAFFGIMTMVIAVPTGVKLFNWLFTMYRGSVRLSSPMIWFLGFVVTFTLGGVTGVMQAVPAIDFQVHNSLFLVAHFHNMIIGGVVFGYMAGVTYWFPKVFGYKLNERIGKYAAWCWIVGFLVAFVPLYALGLMGATRRLDHYDASLGWQGLFMVAGVGALIIVLGIGLQVWQFVYSFLKRHDNVDITGDPWDGRTLEWSTLSPVPEYNFAIIPKVNNRDDFWESKISSSGNDTKIKIKYKDIMLPKNSSSGLLLGVLAVVFGFGIVWHIWWLSALSLMAVLTVLFNRSMTEDKYYLVSANDLQDHEKLRSESNHKGVAV